MRRAISIFMCCLTVLFTGLILYGQAEAAGRGKAASSALLPKELKNISVKDDFIPSSGKEAGMIRTVIGHVVVARENLRQAYFAAAGDKLYEKDILFTLKKSRCRFKLHNEDTVTLGENARMGITAFADDRKTREKRSAFDMARGKAMFFTMRLFKHKGSSMTVSTPTAVAGVRGTKFGVEAIESETNVYVYEGIVDVTSPVTGEMKNLQDGQGVNAGKDRLGDAFQTPKPTSQQFEKDTSVEPPPVIGLGTEGSVQPPLDTGGMDTSTLTQEQNTINIPVQNRPTQHVGYLVGMLTDTSAGSYVTTYISQTPQNFDSTAEATIPPPGGGAVGNVGGVIIDGTGGDVKQVSGLWLNGGSASGLPQPMQRTEIGYNAYMEWGSWTQPSIMQMFESDYVFHNKGYYIWGDVTTDTQMAALRASGGSATYSGGAYGTYWTSGGGVNMTGTFSANANFGQGSLSGFGLNVSGGGYSVSLVGGSGSFGGSSFQINDGTWSMTPIGSVPYTGTGSAAGAFYGPNAEHTGGVWRVGSPGGYANGMFQGTK